MGKPKKSSAKDEGLSLEEIRKKLKRTNKMVTKDGVVKKKLPKQFTPFQCKVCHKVFSNKPLLNAHKAIHLDLEFHCPTCPHVCKTKKYLTRHIRQRHTAAKKHKCRVCDMMFHTPSALKKHFMVHTGEKPLECEVCGKRFRVSYSLNTHMLVHTNLKPFKCSFCEYACRDSSTLRKHEHRHMGILRMFTCKLCPKKFETKSKLKYHVAEIHLDYLDLDLRKYKCEHCGKAFKRRTNMISHIEYTHDKAQSVPCPVCGQRVKHKRYLERHLRIHLPQRPYTCKHEGCGKTFKDKGYLKKHSIIHTPHLHQSCNICGAKFSRGYRLVNHMKTHELREKNVICDYCDVAFYTKNYLIKHITQKHCDNKQHYICDYCGLMTYNKPSIVMHIKYGQCREKDLYCRICKKSCRVRYKNQSTLRNHYLKTHKMKYRPRKNKKKKEKKPPIEIKVEPVDEDPYQEVQLSLLDVSKEEIEIGEDVITEDDQVTYSNLVLSEDLQEYLLKDADEAPARDSFDHFLMQHVFHKQVKGEPDDGKFEEIDEQQEETVTQKIKDIILAAKEAEAKKLEEKRKKKQERILERKLKREAKILRRKKRRERYELERVRLMYNDRMKKAIAEATKKEPAKKITYFKNKVTEDVDMAKENDKTNDSKDQQDTQVLNDPTNGTIGPHNDSASESKSNNFIVNNAINNLDVANDINRTDISNDDMIDVSNNIENLSNDILKNFESQVANEASSVEVEVNINDVITPRNTLSDIEKDKIGEANIENKLTNDGNYSTSDKSSLSDAHIGKNVLEKVVNEENISNDTDNATTDISLSNVEEREAEELGTCYEEHINSNEGKCSNYKEHTIINTGSTTERETSNNNKIDTNNTDSEKDSPNEDKSDSYSDYDPNSADEIAPNKKMNFKTFQCYICFKLFPTKEDLLTHCQIHFDICNSTPLSKCPACGDVVSRKMGQHMRDEHGINVTIPHHKIIRREVDENGSKYCYEMADKMVMEIIPSVKMLNHNAAVALDKKNRERKDMMVAKTKLVKKGNEWILEKVNMDINFEELPQFTVEELSSIPVCNNYTDRLGHLSRLAKSKGVRMMFPCDRCDKICQSGVTFSSSERSKGSCCNSSLSSERLKSQHLLRMACAKTKHVSRKSDTERKRNNKNFSALRLHGRRHDPNKKPFTPRKYKRNCKPPPVAKEKPKVTDLEHRVSKPQPIKNKHKCDAKLKQFYETHIRGADIEFWQFLKIYNKMDRENIQDFKDFEGRVEFGIHTNEDRINNEPKTGNDSTTVSKNGNTGLEKNTPHTELTHESSTEIAQPSNTAKISAKNTKLQNTGAMSRRDLSKSSKQIDRKNQKPAYTRVIMISRKQHLEREKVKMALREKLKQSNREDLGL